MPRIYSVNPAHSIDWAAVTFINGAAAVPAGTDVSAFAAQSEVYTVDDAKHELEPWDKMTMAELDAFYTWLGGEPSDDDTKAQKVAKIETNLSTKYLGSVTASSGAATTGSGKTKITITSPGEYDYWLKTAKTTAPAALYGDVPTAEAGWQKLTLSTGVADEVSPNAATDNKFTVVKVSEDGRVIASATGNLTLKS